MFLRPEPELGWLPTHVQVTILQARGLRAKGKHGTSDAYTLIQVGREKYSTSVVEKTPGSPEWKEECSFELSPGAMERGENCELQLMVMHRALIGMDQFLGQVGIPLQDVYREGPSLRNQWYKLRSKPGKKEKERGELQVSIQFTRNNLTASMFDLSVKDKAKSPFGKLKDKLKVKKHSQMESSSAIVPSNFGRLDSDEEEEKKPKKSKAAAFFKGHLRKSSLTKSNTSLGSDSTISSTSGTVPTSAGVSIVLPDVVKKPASRNSSLSTEPTVKDHDASPRMTHKRAFSDEVSQLKLFPEPKSVQNLKPKGSPMSKSSVCINGSHVYTEVPLPKPTPPLEKSSPASRSFHNIVKKAEDGTNIIRGPSPSPPVLEEQSASLKPVPQPKPRSDPVRVETKPVQITSPMVYTEDPPKNTTQEGKAKDEKHKLSLHPGAGKTNNKSLPETQPHGPASSEERGKVGSWFASKDAKDTPQKPSFPSGSLATSEATERGSSLVEEHSPLDSRYCAEDLNVHAYQGQSGNLEAVADPPEFRLTRSSSSGPPVVSGWEEQFDALASSRLQPSSSQQHKDSETYSFGKEETGTGLCISHRDDGWHHSPSENTCWPEILKNDQIESSDSPPLPTSLTSNFSLMQIPSSGSTGFKSLVANTSEDPNMFSHGSREVDAPVPDSSENRVATVQPILLTEQNMTSLEEAREDVPILTKYIMASVGEREVVEGGTNVHDTQVSKESIEQVSTEHNPERISIKHEVTVEEIIKEHTISVDVGSAAPPKPPRLVKETEDYNYKQTSHKDSTGKQTKNPEEHLQEQSMAGSKLSVSPVACCPVIGIRSPVLGTLTEDSQSTTEGLSTNLRHANKAFSELGAANREHLLDVNDVTATEQFRTCPSIVSLDTDLSSLHEGSDRLELMNRGPSKPLCITLGGSKESPYGFQKPMPLSKIQKEGKSESPSLSKKGDQSDIAFWSALEEQIPSIELDTKQNAPTNRRDSAPLGGGIVDNGQQRSEPKHSKNEDVLVLQRVQSDIVAPNPLAPKPGAKALDNESQHGCSLSQQSSWSADIVVDFKNEDFWRSETNQLDQNPRHGSCTSPGNPFTPSERTPLSHKNPFIFEHPQSSHSSESSLQENISFKDLHALAALPPSDVIVPFPHGSQPLAFSTPSLETAPNPKPPNFPSPIMLLTTPGATTTTITHTATLSGLLSPVAGGVTTAASPILPLETQTADHPFIPLKTSPHPVKPISTAVSESTPEKKPHRPTITTALNSGLEMLKSVTVGQSGTPRKPEQLKDLGLPDNAAKYYHLTHDELIQMLLQREAQLSSKENHVQELEDYIDKLLVRIMDQAPALLQAPLETNK